MGEGIAHQRPAFQHQVCRKKSAHAADNRADPDRFDHVVIAEWLQQDIDHQGFFSSGMARDAGGSLLVEP
nr:hypothetical protein PJ912_24945 [Pectobacterium colocasium]